MFRVFDGRVFLMKKSGRSLETMRKSFKDSLKALEADIQFANTLYDSVSFFFCILIHF